MVNFHSHFVMIRVGFAWRRPTLFNFEQLLAHPFNHFFNIFHSGNNVRIQGIGNLYKWKFNSCLNGISQINHVAGYKKMLFLGYSDRHGFPERTIIFESFTFAHCNLVIIDGLCLRKVACSQAAISQ